MSHWVKSMFSVRETPWHYAETGVALEDALNGKKGTVVLDDYPGRERAMELADHAFEVEEHPIGVIPVAIDAVLSGEEFNVEVASAFKALQRSDTGAVFDVTRHSYETIQNGTAWDVIDAIIDEPRIFYETGGTLKEGAECWVLARIDEPMQPKGDESETYPFVLVSWGHHVGYALKAILTAVRVVCWNTYSAALAASDRGEGATYTFRHTAGVYDRIEEAKEALGAARSEFAAFRELSEELSSEQVTMRKIDRFLAEFLPAPAEFETSDLVKKHIEEARAKVKATLDGPTGAGHTKWGLFQAGIEYLDYGRPYRNEETLFGRTLIRPVPLKKKLVKLVRSL